MFQVINGVELRIVNKDDAPAIYQAFKDNEAFLNPYIDFVSRISMPVIVSALENWERDQVLARGVRLGLFKEGVCLGMVSLRIDSNDNRGELGYWLVEEATGQGLMTRAAGQLVDLAFSAYRLNKVSIQCADSNLKSQAVAKRLGFFYEARLRSHQRLNGDYVDLLVFSKLREEWLAEKK